MSVDTKQLNELCQNFDNIESRKKVIELYQDVDTSFSGNNENNETVEIHVSPSGLVTKTYQNNGWIRVNYYDSCGVAEGESFEGRWN